MVRVTLFVTSLCFLSLACSDDDKQALTAGDAAAGDSAISPDLGVDMPYSLGGSCTGCVDHVLDRVLMPTSSEDVAACAVEHKGKKYNALGQVMVPLILTLTKIDTQEAPDLAIHSGKALNLLRLKAKGLTNAATAVGQLWPGKTRTCCSKPGDAKACKAEAYKTCFGGSGVFSPDPKAPAATAIKGSITGGKLALGPGKVVARFPIAETPAMDMPISGARISGALTAKGLTSGCLTGALTAQAIDTVLLPRLAGWLNSIPKGDPSKKTYLPLEYLLDLNKDGVITVAELKQNTLLQTFLKGDLDMDGDGTLDMTLGFRFSAVRAVIKP